MCGDWFRISCLASREESEVGRYRIFSNILAETSRFFSRNRDLPMKTALHSVSYAGVWSGQARLELSEFMERAKALGFDAVMLMAKRPHLPVLDQNAESRRRFQQQAKDLGLEVACLAGYTDFGQGADHPE